MSLSINAATSSPPKPTEVAIKKEQTASTEPTLASVVDLSSLSTDEGRKLFQRVLTDSLNSPELSEAIANFAEPLSNEGLAEQIYSGISGGIFQGFLRNNPDLTEGQFEGFMSSVRKGVNSGAREAKSILESLGALSGNLEFDIEESMKLLAEKLDKFEQETKERLFGEGAKTNTEE